MNKNIFIILFIFLTYIIMVNAGWIQDQATVVTDSGHYAGYAANFVQDFVIINTSFHGWLPHSAFGGTLQNFTLKFNASRVINRIDLLTKQKDTISECGNWSVNYSNDNINWNPLLYTTNDSCVGENNIRNISRTFNATSMQYVKYWCLSRCAASPNDVGLLGEMFINELINLGAVTTIELNYPQSNTWNGSRTINFSYAPILNSSEVYGCHLFVNTTTGWRNVITNNSPILNYTENKLSFTYSSDGNFLWNIMCNLTNGASTFAASNFTLKIDTANPVITINSQTDNIYTKKHTLLIDTKCVDDYVFYLNWTLYNASMYVMNTSQNTTTTASILTLNATLNTTGYKDGRYTLNVSCSDGHTASFLKAADSVTKTGDAIEFNFKNDIIKVEVQQPSTSITNFNAVKLDDRYIFDVDFHDIVTKFYYKIYADSITEYRSKYKGHLILDNKYWFDTEPYDAVITETGKGYVILEVSGYGDTFITESIGGLNIVNTEYNITIDRTSPILTDLEWNTYHPVSNINSSNLTYNDILAYFNISWVETNNVSCGLSLKNPAITVYNNLSMSNIEIGKSQFNSQKPQMNVTGIWNVSINCYDNAGNYNTTSSEISVYYYNNVTYNSPVLRIEYTNISITFANISNRSLSLLLNYNGTIYEPTTEYYDDDTNWTRFSFIVTGANITLNEDIIYFNFSYNYSYLDGSNYDANETRKYLQHIYKGQLTSCGLETNTTAINLTFWNEQFLDHLNVSGELILTIWDFTPTLTSTFNLSFTNRNEYQVCIFPAYSRFYADAYIKYTATDGFTHRYYLYHANISNNTNVIPLYNFNYTTGISNFKGTVRYRSDYTYFPNVYSKLMRYYISENVWRVVQMDKSDDFGQILFNVIEKNQDYKIIFEYNGSSIYTTNQMKFYCTAGLCELVFALERSTSTSITTFDYIVSYDNNTGVVTLNWNDVTNVITDIRLWVTKDSGSSVQTICDTHLSSSAGSLLCNTSGHYGTIVVKAYSSSSPEMPFYMQFWDRIVEGLSKLPTFDKREGAFWGMGIVLTIAAFGTFFGGFATIIFTMFSIIVLVFLDITPLIKLGTAIALGIMSIVIALLIKR